MIRLAPLALLLAACGKDGAGDDTGFCGTAPVVTYANFGEGFMTQNCQSCHASTASNRNGAPDQVVFDTLDDVLGQADRILARSVGDDATMPPSGGVSEDDRYLLEVWLTCWE